MTRMVCLIAVGMNEAAGCAGRHFGQSLVVRMIAVVFVALVTLMTISLCSRLMHLLCSGTHSHVCRHGVASPAAQRQQDHHESEHKQTHF